MCAMNGGEDYELLFTVVGSDYDKIKQIATISANNDTIIGELIADAFQKVGSARLESNLKIKLA